MAKETIGTSKLGKDLAETLVSFVNEQAIGKYMLARAVIHYHKLGGILSRAYLYSDVNSKGQLAANCTHFPGLLSLVSRNGFQMLHYMTMVGGTLSQPFILSVPMCFSNNPLAIAEVLCTMFFVSGIATIIQATFGVRLPIVQGGTFSFLAPIFAILSLPKWQCHPVAMPTNSTLSNGTLEFVYDLPSTLLVYDSPSTLLVYDLPSTLLVYDSPSTLLVYDLPYTLLVYDSPSFPSSKRLAFYTPSLRLAFYTTSLRLALSHYKVDDMPSWTTSLRLAVLHYNLTICPLGPLVYDLPSCITS
ncbi:predicted protein [Nematostella vectensis]|uniref:Uncharacterized protein n=1 Tax=Nematostella vectensis TaxID=45351 RepID=A7T1W9_NEMVE|nr:predicted protein [Nematostella vectensis]|eukprot:XP_001622144.1 predicted protein [Nematostella vectensis]